MMHLRSCVYWGDISSMDRSTVQTHQTKHDSSGKASERCYIRIPDPAIRLQRPSYLDHDSIKELRRSASL